MRYTHFKIDYFVAEIVFHCNEEGADTMNTKLHNVKSVRFLFENVNLYYTEVLKNIM